MIGDDGQWSVLFLGLREAQGHCANASRFRFAGRSLRVTAQDDYAGLDVAAIDWHHLAAAFVARRFLEPIARHLREEAGNWEAVLVVVDDGPVSEQIAQLTEFGVFLTVPNDCLVGNRLCEMLALVLNDHAIELARRHISEATGELLEANSLSAFAERALRVAGELPDVPADRLFGLRHGNGQLFFAIAGCGRFAHQTAMPLSEQGDGELRRRIELGPPDVESWGEDNWLCWAIPTLEGESLLFYFENSDGRPPRINFKLRRLLSTRLTATYDHLIRFEQVRRSHRAAIVALADLAEFKDTDTGEHVMRVARMTDEITWVLREKGYYLDSITDEFIEQVGIASILHDVGKVGVPDRVLLKPGKLDNDERIIINSHTTRGFDFLSRVSGMVPESLYLPLAAQIAEAHHEHWDGSGYPHGLKGEQIPLAARIVAVVDVFDALISQRPYKKPWPLDEAIEYIRSRAGSQFDAKVVDAFVTVMERRAMVSLIEWRDEMSVGVEALDADHRRLLGLINQLATAQALGNRNIVGYVLDELVEYTEEHFRREEAHMAAIGFPDLEAHYRLHRRFEERLAQVRWQHVKGLRANLPESMLSFLGEWLNQHIMQQDMNYSVYSGVTAG